MTESIRSAFTLRDASDPDLAWIFDQLSPMSTLSNHYSRVSIIYSQIVTNIEREDWEPAKKKMVARKFSRHFDGTAEAILDKSRPESLSDEKHQEIVKYFTKKVSSKDYKRYFKNIENEVAPPSETWPAMRFYSFNKLTFALRALESNFWDTLKSGFMLGFTMFAILLALVVIPTLIIDGVVGLLSFLTLKGVCNLFLFSVIVSIPSLPVIALATMHDNFVDSMNLLGEIVSVAIPVLIVSTICDVGLYGWRAISSWFSGKPVVPPSSETTPNPAAGPRPDPLAVPLGEPSNAVFQLKKEKNADKKELEESDILSSNQHSCKIL